MRKDYNVNRYDFDDQEQKLVQDYYRQTNKKDSNMKKFIIGMMVIVTFILVGCDSGDTTVEPAAVTVPVTVVEVPVEVLPEPENVLFEDLRVEYDVTAVTCDGGQALVSMSFLPDESIDPFAFELKYSVEGEITKYSNMNVDEGNVVLVTETIFVPANTTDGVIRHSISIFYYGETTVQLSERYFDQSACE